MTPKQVTRLFVKSISRATGSRRLFRRSWQAHAKPSWRKRARRRSVKVPKLHTPIPGRHQKHGDKDDKSGIPCAAVWHKAEGEQEVEYLLFSCVHRPMEASFSRRS